MKYMLILYAYDKNTILVEPIKTRSDTDMLRVYYVLYNILENVVQAPRMNIMGNERSKPFKRLLQKIITVIQLAPPHIQSRKAADWAICTFKNHFVAELASVDNNFPIYLLCRILKQAKITIDLLRTSVTKTILSASVKIFVPFDFNTTPTAPMGTKITAHEK